MSFFISAYSINAVNGINKLLKIKIIQFKEYVEIRTKRLPLNLLKEL